MKKTQQVAQYCTEQHRSEVIKLLIEKGAGTNDRNNRGETPLHLAAFLGRRKNVKVLIEGGATVNAKSNNKAVPLHLACLARRIGTIEELIKAGADVNAVERSSKFAPLHLACMVAEIKIVEELVKAGGNVEQKDKSGKTPMDYARNSKEIKEVLENVKMANKQREFIERVRVVSESTAAGVIVAKEELETVDEKVL